MIKIASQLEKCTAKAIKTIVDLEKVQLLTQIDGLSNGRLKNIAWIAVMFLFIVIPQSRDLLLNTA